MQRRSMLKFSAAGLAGLTVRSLAADTPSAGDLAGDMAIMRQALALHPGLYRYQTSAQFEARFAALQRDFVGAGSIDQRYLALSRFLSTIRCGHSYANFFNQKKAVATALFDRPTRLPFHFRWIGDAMVVTAGALPRGTIVTAIDGRPPIRLRDRLMPLIRADGHNDAKRISLLEVRGDDRIETFDVFQGLVAPPRGGVHRLRVIEPGKSERPIDLPAIALAARQAQMAASDAAPDAPLWRWTMRPDGVALLTMPGWAVWDSKWDWQGWLNDRLDSLGGARGLIVDLRDNEGGADCGDVILARMISRRFVPARAEQRLRFRTTPPAIDRYLDTWDDSFRTLGATATPLADGFYLRPAGDDALAIDPSPKRLGVPVVMLSSPVNSSATFQFASNLRAIGGKLVGRTTGGNRRGINGGCFFFVRLPASGLEFDLPLVGYFPLDPQPDAGIVPDVMVTDTAADIAAGRDPTLDRAVATILRG